MRRLFFCLQQNTSGYSSDSGLFFTPKFPYNSSKEEVNAMTPRERILALRLLEKQKRKPEYTTGIGIQVRLVNKDSGKMEEKHV